MPKRPKTLLPWRLVPASFTAGLQIGPRVAGGYHTAFPPHRRHPRATTGAAPTTTTATP